LVEGKSGTAVPAWPLFDTLKDRVEGGVRVVTSGDPNDAVTVRIVPELYWKDGAIRYTTDGSAPRVDSPVYGRPFMVSKPTQVRVAMLDENGDVKRSKAFDVSVTDTRPPRLVKVQAGTGSRLVVLDFSEPLRADSLDPKHIFVEPNTVTHLTASPDGKRVTLELGHALIADVTYFVTLNGIADRAPKSNFTQALQRIDVRGPVYTLESFAPGSPSLEVKDVAGLPIKGSQPWTINCFVKMDKQPENRTLIAGFGRTAKTTGGDGRYLAKFSGGAHFWSHHGDLSSTSAFELGKWQMLTATFDGKTVRLYKDGVLIGENEGELADDENVVRIAPLDPWEKERRFGGEIRSFTIWDQALSEDALKSMRDEAKLP